MREWSNPTGVKAWKRLAVRGVLALLKIWNRLCRIKFNKHGRIAVRGIIENCLHNPFVPNFAVVIVKAFASNLQRDALRSPKSHQALVTATNSRACKINTHQTHRNASRIRAVNKGCQHFFYILVKELASCNNLQRRVFLDAFKRHGNFWL
jgi:hypothetical protein